MFDNAFGYRLIAVWESAHNRQIAWKLLNESQSLTKNENILLKEIHPFIYSLFDFALTERTSLDGAASNCRIDHKNKSKHKTLSLFVMN